MQELVFGRFVVYYNPSFKDESRSFLKGKAGVFDKKGPLVDGLFLMEILENNDVCLIDL